MSRLTTWQKITIGLDISVSETPIRHSEKKEIITAILCGERNGVLNPDTVSEVIWKVNIEKKS